MRRKYLIRLGILAVATVVSVLLLEVILRITGIGMPPTRLMLTNEGLVPRPTKGPAVFDETQFPIPVKRSPDAPRQVFFFGGSSTQGFPYPEYSWPAVCENISNPKSQTPNLKAVNFGMLQGSLRDCRLLLQELLDWRVQPDAIVIHSANNELYYNRVRILDEYHHPTKKRLKGLRRYSRIADILYRRAGSKVPSDPKALHALYPLNESNRKILMQAYEADLRQIGALCRQHRIYLILTTVPINRDYWAPSIPPDIDEATRNLVRKGIVLFYKQDFEAAENTFQEALSKSPDEPVSHFYLGRIQSINHSLDHLELALLHDTFRPVRATPDHNEIIRRIAKEESLPLVDFDGILLGRHGIAGKKLFIDNCHGRPETYREMGILLAKALNGDDIDVSEAMNTDTSISNQALERVQALVKPLQDKDSAFLKEWVSNLKTQIPKPKTQISNPKQEKRQE